MRLLSILIAVLFLGILGSQIYSSLLRGQELTREFKRLEEEVKKAQTSQRELQSDLEYFSNPENFEKELRARFNYHDPNEKMIIIVPKTSASSASSQ